MKYTLANRFYIKTIGCKLNYTESAGIVAFLLDNHCIPVDKSSADVFILNTCTVTGQAEKKCIQEVRAFHKVNPAAPVVVTGCFANLNAGGLEKEKNVVIVSGKDVQQKKEVILNFILTGKNDNVKCSSESFSLVWSNTRTRCFLKIQDGCDNKCAYCTVHLARGNSRSATIREVCATLLDIAKLDIKEVVLTGLNTADFGRKNGERFIDLLRAIEKLKGIGRYRISSIEPNLLTEEIIDFVKNSGSFLPHFHIPLQSGSDRVLRLMGRRYLTTHFKNTIEQIKHHIPDAFIGVDIIAGMNGETEQDFCDSYNFVKDMPLSFLHVFPYSERPDTDAVNFTPKVSSVEKQRRTKMYLSLSDEKLMNFYQHNIGKTFDVLLETGSNRCYYGFTPNYIKVELTSETNLKNRIIPVTLSAINPKTGRVTGLLSLIH
jgi:threonylcarbamoyladenosine tRNA methylthiotransferase MtaB